MSDKIFKTAILLISIPGIISVFMAAGIIMNENSFLLFNSLMVILGICFLFAGEKKEKINEEKKKTCTASLIHDLKTPNIAQIKVLDLLLNKYFGELTKEQTDIISQIKNSCKYMNSLILTILDTYVYENGEKKLSCERTNIKESVEEIINEMSYLAKEREQNIIVSANIKTGILYADKLQIKRAITNLISNAIKYGRSDSDILISIEENEDNINFSVRNKAKYYNKEELREMFKKYKSISNKYIKSGTGLGLYLSKKIIEKHQGKIYAESREDAWCIFGFIIPKSTCKINELSSQKKKVREMAKSYSDKNC